jgi:hypothetical protein
MGNSNLFEAIIRLIKVALTIWSLGNVVTGVIFQHVGFSGTQEGMLRGRNYRRSLD